MKENENIEQNNTEVISDEVEFEMEELEQAIAPIPCIRREA